MFFASTKPRRSCIGIDVGSRHINAVQLDGRGPARRISSAMAFARVEPGQALLAADVKALPALLKRAGFVGNRVALCAALDAQFGGVLEMPRSEKSAYAPMARMELAGANRCPPDSFELDCWQLPDGAQKSASALVMAVACKHASAMAQLDLFESAGFDVETLDLRACAIARAADLKKSTAGGMTAILELNWQAALLVMVHQGVVIYERKLADCDLQRVHDALMQRLQVDCELADYLLLDGGLDALAGDAPVPRQARSILSGHVDGLCTELSASLAYAAEPYGEAVALSLLLCGDGAAMPGLDRRLAEELRIEAAKISPAEMCAVAPGVSDSIASPSMMTALGLAL
jgi:type IV pilus assembly protein PilM